MSERPEDQPDWSERLDQFEEHGFADTQISDEEVLALIREARRVPVLDEMLNVTNVAAKQLLDERDSARRTVNNMCTELGIPDDTKSVVNAAKLIVAARDGTLAELITLKRALRGRG